TRIVPPGCSTSFIKQIKAPKGIRTYNFGGDSSTKQGKHLRLQSNQQEHHTSKANHKDPIGGRIHQGSLLTQVMGEEGSSASEEEYNKGITSASEEEYWNSTPVCEASSITKDLQGLRVQPTRSTIEPKEIRTPKRKNTSPISSSEVKKRFLNPMVPPKFNEVIQRTLWVVDVLIDAESEVTMTKDQGDLISEELTKALFASDKMNILDFDHCGYERNLYRTISRNTETRDWVLATIPTLKFDKWPEAKLKTVEAGKTPKMWCPYGQLNLIDQLNSQSANYFCVFNFTTARHQN
ncbi:hypothetical protein Bhyg_03021, partial [Pseudolycoriella hygida]